MGKQIDLVYLGKEGKAFGPFSPEEVEELKTTGKYILYSWVWDGVSGDWTPINPPPPPAGAVVRKSTAVKKRATGSLDRSLRADSIHALCHDNQNIVSGVVADVAGQSFTLESDTKSTLPIFQRGHKVLVNLFDETSGRGENVRAVVVGTSRRRGRWEYQMQWDRPPSLVKLSSAE